MTKWLAPWRSQSPTAPVRTSSTVAEYRGSRGNADLNVRHERRERYERYTDHDVYEVTDVRQARVRIRHTTGDE
jgi:hypothetical protein